MHMKRIVTWLAMAAALLFVAACAPGETTATTTGSVYGNIVDSTGTAVADATVSADGQQVTTNDQGFFSLSGVESGRTLVDLNATGYANSQVTVDVIAGRASFVEGVMLGFDVQDSFIGSTGGTVSNADGSASVQFGANSLVDESGATHTGNVNVDVAILDASDSGELSAFPGDFSGRDDTGTDGQLASYGALGVEITDDNGNSLDLASGESSDINIPVSGDPNAAPDTIPLFFYDSETGVWMQEGTATKTEISAGVWAYVGTVNHYSWWNADVLYEQAFLNGRVVTASGDAVAGARITSVGQDYNGEGEATSDASGNFRVPVRPSSQVVVQATAGAGVATTGTINTPGSAGGESDIGDIVIEAPELQIILTWGQTPDDLDAHLTGPTDTSDRFHVYYSQQGSLTSSPYAQLDTDDTSSFGPEIITVTRVFDGVYRYSVHDYANRSSTDSNALANSGATVEVRVDGAVVATYDVPAQEGTLWTVFEFQNGNVTDVDTMSYEENPVDVTSTGLSGESLPAKR